MEKIEDFRRNAEECRVRARSMPEGEVRARLQELAEAWEALADDRERILEQQRRIEMRSDDSPADLHDSEVL